MANKSLFKSIVGKLIPQADGRNEEGAAAYKFTPEQALAQYAMTGCMNMTFYASAVEQLSAVLNFANQVAPEFIARLAIYARQKGYMKDLPAFLCAVLSLKNPKLLQQIFPRVIDNGKMLRNFVQIMRSGAVGRKSLGSLPKKLVLEWLDKHSEEALFRDSVGNSPSLADVVKMVHPKPSTPEREAFYGYLINKEHKADLLPGIVVDFEAYKAKSTSKVPAVPFQMLTSLELGKDEWREIARNAAWQMTRMNLNTFLRHGVFEDHELVKLVAKRLADPTEVRKARAFPYQLLMAYRMANEGVPGQIREALQDAMEVAIENVPEFAGQVVICPDVSGSMSSPVTGQRAGATTAVRCIDVAALVAAAAMRRNPTATVFPFEQKVVSLTLNPRDSVMTNAEKLASIGGGGTNCSAPLTLLNEKRIKADVVVLVSDNESWVDAAHGRGTATMQEWGKFKASNPHARLVCLDIAPYATTQAIERADILNIGGFSDQVFEVLGQFSNGTLNPNHFVGLIDGVEI